MSSKPIQDVEVLVVDDDPHFRMLLPAILESMGVGKVETAADGDIAWLMISEVPFDAIVCDWEMPNMTGIELLRKMREAGLDTPFLMLTGRATGEDVAEAARLGVDAYIAKPFEAEALQRKLRVLLSRITDPR